MKIFLRFTTVVLLSVFMFSCEGEDGAPGFQGEQGLQGEQGPAGQDGADGQQGEQGPAGQDGADGQDGTNGTNGTNGTDGQDGETGTANVIYSDWIPSEFSDNESFSFSFRFIRGISELTEDILNSGTVLVYGGDTGTGTTIGTVYMLPTDRFGNSYSYFIGVNTITLEITSLNASAIGAPFFESYRYVIIPGGVAAGKNAAAVDYTKMSYEEITTLFNIPD